MTTLEWSETAEGYASAGYRITRAGTHQWAIDLDSSDPRTVIGRRSTEIRVFNSLKSARAAALHMEVVRIRRLKLIRHVTVSFMMLCLSIGSYVAMATGTETFRLEWFILAGVALYSTLREGLDALVLLISDGWDHRYEVPRITIIDRTVTSAIISTVWPRTPKASALDHDVRVRPLT